MDATEELELVPPEYRHEHKPRVHMASSDLPIMRSSGPQLEGCGIPMTGNTVTVYITFYTEFDKKVIRTELGPRDSLDELAWKANELFPEHKWRLFSGTQHHADSELLTPQMVYEAVKSTFHWDFHYLLIHLIPLDYCDVCRQPIRGRRFTCLPCQVPKICEECKDRSVHSKHVVLETLDPATMDITLDYT